MDKTRIMERLREIRAVFPEAMLEDMAAARFDSDAVHVYAGACVASITIADEMMGRLIGDLRECIEDEKLAKAKFDAAWDAKKEAEQEALKNAQSDQ